MALTDESEIGQQTEMASEGAANRMTPEHCEQQLFRLGVLKGIPDDVFEYYAALKDIPDERFTAAIDRALKTRSWFPTPAQLREDVDLTRPVAPLVSSDGIEELVGGGRELVLTNPISDVELRIPIKRIWKWDCPDCTDTGWFSRHCPGDHCGRRHEHAPHEWVTRCHCYDRNPTIQRRLAANAKYAEPKI